jgi:hypothetical protein
MYADAHDGRLPRRGQGVQPTTVLHRQNDWFNALPPLMDGQPYVQLLQQSQRPRAGLNSVWICPEAIAPEDGLHLRASAFFPYGMNMALSTWLAPQPDHIDRIGPKQTMVFMADSMGPMLFCAAIGTRLPTNRTPPAATTMIGASRDNTIYQRAVNNSAGGAAGIVSGANGQGSPRRGLVTFDVAGSVPAGAVITAAEE